MTNKRVTERRNLTLATAAFIAIVPPLWAVLSPQFGVETGAVALICAGIFTAEGNDPRRARGIICGLLIGIPWGILALRFTVLPGSHSVNQFLALAFLGAGAVLICGLTVVGRYIDTTSWLTGWAITILILGHVALVHWHWLPLQLALSMLTGVYLIGVGGVMVNRWLEQRTYHHG
jgi:hypothetical protein